MSNELCLYFAARAQHLAEKDTARIRQSTWVISGSLFGFDYVIKVRRAGCTKV